MGRADRHRDTVLMGAEIESDYEAAWQARDWDEVRRIQGEQIRINRGEAWLEGHAAALHNVAWPRERKRNPYVADPYIA